MRRLAGQATRAGGRLLRALAHVALALVVAAAVLLGVATWQLSRGPVELPWLAARLAAAFNADHGDQLSLGGAAIAWEGFQGGVDQPLDIRLRDAVVRDAAGRPIAVLPRGAVSLAAAPLLHGRLVPRAIAVEGVRLRLVRDADGRVALAPGASPGTPEAAIDIRRLLDEVSRAPRSGPGRWSELRRVRVAGATLSIADARLGATGTASDLAIDLRRGSEGGVAGSVAAELALAGVTARLTAQARLQADGRQTEIAGSLTPIEPAALAGLFPAAAAVAAPVTLSVAARLDDRLALAGFTAAIEVGEGQIHLGRGMAPVVAAEIGLAGTPAQMQVTLRRWVTAPRPDAPPTTLAGHAMLTRAGGTIAASVTLDLDHVAFADLPALWPEGVGGAGARAWITGNITDGVVRNFHVELGMQAPEDLSDATVTRLAGGGEGGDVTVHWLRPVPPIVHAAARVHFLSPDRLEVVATGGSEVIGDAAITLRGGRVVFSGLLAPDQLADIDADLAGPVPAALALLADKRIGLLARSPLKVADAAGQFAGHVGVTGLSLRNDVAMNDLKIATAMKLTALRLGGIVAGRDLDRGTLDVAADADGLHADGAATLAGIPAQLKLDMDFRLGPPSQVQQTVTVAGSIDARQLAGLGVDPAGFATGAASVTARLIERRDHAGEATVNADLAGTALDLAPLDWRKPAGKAASVLAHLRLDHDRIAAVDAISAVGEGLALSGSAGFADGRPAVLRIDRAALGDPASGQFTDAHGTIAVPQQAGEPWRATLAGASLDATAALRRGKPHAPPAGPTPKGPPWMLDARFDRVALGPGRSLASVAVSAGDDGEILRRLTLTGRTPGRTPGRTQDAAPFSVSVVPLPDGRHLAASVPDLGALLRATGVTADVDGGRLSLVGRYDDNAPGHPLSGRAEATDFRVRGAPVLAKLLQAVTLYGVVDLMRGPGLGVRRLVAPFRFVDDQLDLSEARAFSASLGMTAKGRIDLGRQSFDLQGTIVPAYFFNTLLGDLPLVGRLFSPERGGGVFAATYTLRGPFDDPAVAINPLAALTPGFLRGLFGLFSRPAAGGGP